jgi:hypothetical protein
MRSQIDAVTVDGPATQIRDVSRSAPAFCHALRMSTKHTKSEKSQRKADELEERLDDQPEANEKKEVQREEPSRADIDTVRHRAHNPRPIPPTQSLHVHRGSSHSNLQAHICNRSGSEGFLSGCDQREQRTRQC